MGRHEILFSLVICLMSYLHRISLLLGMEKSVNKFDFQILVHLNSNLAIMLSEKDLE